MTYVYMRTCTLLTRYVIEFFIYLALSRRNTNATNQRVGLYYCNKLFDILQQTYLGTRKLRRR